jgi:hypothetical protein
LRRAQKKIATDGSTGSSLLPAFDPGRWLVINRRRSLTPAAKNAERILIKQ